MSHFFVHENDSYSTELDPITTYIEQNAILIMKKYNISYDEAVVLIKEVLKENEGIKDPIVKFWKRDKKTLDREISTMKLSRYIGTIKSEKLVLAPSFTCYYKTMYHPDGTEKPFVSLDSLWTEKNASLRNDFKKLAKKDYRSGNMLGFAINDTIQKTKKIMNNSLSGNYSQEHLPLGIDTGHSTLTSTTRLVSGIGNMISEKMVGGNRFYRVKNDVMAEFLSILDGANIDLIADAVIKYNLTIPTVDDVIEMVIRSSKWYWKNPTYIEFIRDFLTKLSGYELCAILYVHDMYHIQKLNPYMMQMMISKLSKEMSGISNDVNIIKNGVPYLVNLTHHVCFTTLKKHGIDYDEYANTPIADRLVSTYLHIERTMEEYRQFIDAFFKSIFVNPINIGSLKEMVRTKIVLSDTDSTCATYFDFVNKTTTRFKLGDETIGMSAVVMVFTSELSNHLLKVLTSTMNAEKDKWYALEMKPEYTWSMFTPMGVSKHYLNSTIVKELFVLKKQSVDVSGVSLIATNIPKVYHTKLEEFEAMIVDAVETGIPVYIRKLLTTVADIERDIMETVKVSPNTILKYEKIKEEGTYKQDWTRSNYFHYKLYEEVFEKKYGGIDKAPITALKLPIKFTKTKDLIEYLETLDDREFANAFIDILKRSKKQSLSSLKVPHAIVGTKGVFEEIVPIINFKQIVFDIMRPFYIILESIGIKLREDRIVMEEFDV